MSPKANCSIYSAQLLYVSASRGGLPYFGEFFPVNRVIYSSLCAFMPPKVNCAIYSAQLVYVCVCVRVYDLGSVAKFRQDFPCESCYLQLAVCIYASQSELRHLQCTVSVCVCVCVYMI